MVFWSFEHYPALRLIGNVHFFRGRSLTPLLATTDPIAASLPGAVAQWVRLLNEDTLLLLLHGDLQLATDSLVPLEQFGLGDPQTVRGYRQNALLTDSGALFSSEIRVPVLHVPEVDGLLQVIPFVDIGYGWNISSLAPEEDILAALGVGALWQMGDRFDARLDIGIPLVNIADEGNSLQESGIHFTLDYRLF